MKIVKTKNPRLAQSGFTLIELLVVVGILGVLMAITIIALNPAKHFADARNAQRQSDVIAVLDGIYEYEASNSGSVPANLSSFAYTTAKSLGALPNETATSTTFATGQVTYTGITGNVVTDASVTVTGCSAGADNGTFPVVSGTGTTVVATNASGVAAATGCILSGYRVDLCSALVPTYMAAMPSDPSGSTGTSCSATYTSGYKIAVNAAGNRYTVTAPSAENGATVSVTR
jgi:prepilin-type N-terminal cleavage/methylation domain-containing protein